MRKSLFKSNFILSYNECRCQFQLNNELISLETTTKQLGIVHDKQLIWAQHTKNKRKLEKSRFNLPTQNNCSKYI